MIESTVTISGILMCCDESICAVSLGRDYAIEKCELNDLFFIDKIKNNANQINHAYYNSQIIEEEKTFFICVKKETSIKLKSPSFCDSNGTLTDKDIMCESEIDEYVDQEINYLNEQINLLRLFKEGNIGFKEVFFKFSFLTMGFIKNNISRTVNYETRNIVSDRKFVLTENEFVKCNNWLNDYRGEPYSLIKDNIEEFSWGLEQIDIPTGFEQYTTSLEMTLLPINQPGKKQMLANRISALLETTPNEIRQTHQKILNYYRYRSESLHEGDGTNITDAELFELENITRSVLKKCLERCKTEYENSNGIDWITIKDKIMNDLLNIVANLKASGILPA